MNFRNNTKKEIKLVEKFNSFPASRLLLSDKIPSDGKRILRKYLDKLDNEQVEVTYTNANFGRLESGMTKLKEGETCYTQNQLWNIMKDVGCRGIYTDVDISCCHPNLLVQLFKELGCNTKYLETYIHDRNKLATEMNIDMLLLFAQRFIF